MAGRSRDWRIPLADYFSAHRSRDAFNLAWSRGYVLLIHGGGATPVAQTCDTDLNQHVRREYGVREAVMLINKMRGGEVVPKLTNEQCMELMLEVLSDPGLHARAADGYKKTGQSIDMHGPEDELICRDDCCNLAMAMSMATTMPPAIHRCVCLTANTPRAQCLKF